MSYYCYINELGWEICKEASENPFLMEGGYEVLQPTWYQTLFESIWNIIIWPFDNWWLFLIILGVFVALYLLVYPFRVVVDGIFKKLRRFF